MIGTRAFTLLHLSDLHFKGDREPDCAVLEAAVGAVVRDQGLPGVKILVVTGDLVDKATSSALAAAKAFVGRLSNLFAHTLVIPGNHDAKEFFGNFGYSLEDYKEAFGSDTNLLIREAGLHLIGVDSTPAEFARGRVIAEEYDSLIRHVYASETVYGGEKAGIIRIIAIHHHPLPLAEGEENRTLGLVEENYMYLQAPAKFLEACVTCHVNLIIHGHRHVLGLAKYSLPTEQTIPYYTDDAWRDLYVLSSPSSTGKGCDAGFNVITSEGSGTFLDVIRYRRKRNTGTFEPNDGNFPNSRIRLHLGRQLERDVAVDVAAALTQLGAQPLEKDLLPLATRLFKRRAFYMSRERDWRFLFYAVVKTRMVWEQDVQPKMQERRQSASDQVRQVLNRLESYIEEKVLDVSGLDADHQEHTRRSQARFCE
jgi:Icc protein